MRGEIYSTEAYARGKMLDHQGWNRVLPRNITPSDIDAVIENSKSGIFIFMEYNSRTCNWCKLPQGQRRMYENLVVLGKGDAYAILVHHGIPEVGVPIDTLADALEFQVMEAKERYGVWLTELSPVYPGDRLAATVTQLGKF